MFILAILLCTFLVKGSRVNRSIDDTHGDLDTEALPTYEGPWNQGTKCTVCVTHPDPALAFLGDWHDATHDRGHPDDLGINLSFNGTCTPRLTLRTRA